MEVTDEWIKWKKAKEPRIKYLERIAKRMSLGVFTQYDLDNSLYINVNFVLCNYLKVLNTDLGCFLNLYFYYIEFLIPSIHSIRLTLFYTNS